LVKSIGKVLSYIALALSGIYTQGIIIAPLINFESMSQSIIPNLYIIGLCIIFALVCFILALSLNRSLRLKQTLGTLLLMVVLNSALAAISIGSLMFDPVSRKLFLMNMNNFIIEAPHIVLSICAYLATVSLAGGIFYQNRVKH
jgi:ABC-type sugar transport system permease subunit